MALREGTRRWLMRGLWATLLVAAALLVGLQLGRPAYYTDGVRTVAGSELATAGMLEWAAPEVVAELPGPVVGRVARLPDGRLCYGQLVQGQSDLVTWDPARPQLPPEPVYGVNTPAHEVAPTLLADGRLWFASDRPGGAGGYDLYQAPRLLARSDEVTPVPAAATALDETDPTLSPDGTELVFVRSDRRRDDGHDGVLYRWRLGDALDPAPLFPALAAARRRPAQRDPMFGADGASLWFVQQELPGARTALLRSSRCGDRLAAPLAIGATWRGPALRSPWPSDDGRTLWLLAPATEPGAAALWYAATGHELVPWWPGQRWLEWVLAGVVLVAALLLVLLHFGRRWSTLDLVAQCILCSLLVHLLLCLWLMGVELHGAWHEGDDDSAGFEVSIVAASAAAAAGGGNVVAAAAQFTPRARELTAAAPSAATRLPAAAQQLAAGAASELAAVPASTPAIAAPALADAASEPAPRTGDDPAVPVTALAVPAPVPDPAATAALAGAAERATVRAAAVVVTAPGGSLPRAAADAALLATSVVAGAPQALGRDVPAAARGPSQPVVLQDAAAAASATAQVAGDAPTPAPSLAAAAAVVAPTLASAAATASPSPSPPAAAGSLVVPAPPRPGLLRAAGSPMLATAPLAMAAAPAPAANRATAAPSLREPAARLATGTAAATAAVAPAAAAPRPAAPAAVGLPVGPVGQSPLAAASRPSDAAAPPTPAVVAAPRSGLLRPRLTLPAGGAALPAPSQPAAARGVARPSAELRQAEPSGAAARAANLAAPGRPAAPAPVALAATTLAAGAALERPQRANQLGALAATRPAVPPPPSRLPRVPVVLHATSDAAPSATAGAYSNRFGPAKAQALERFGGSEATERAVGNGLRYLAGIQQADGSWGNVDDFDGKYGMVYVGKTALCLLAFLGAGHTPSSGTAHSQVVQRALQRLLALQDPDTGAFGPSSCYGHGISTYALAECYGMTKDRALRQPLERALTWILDHQGPRRDRRNRGGWGYFSPGLRAEDDYARVSVTAWMVMALESARLSGIELPAAVLPAAREYLELAYDQPNGWFRYNHKPDRLRSSWPTLPASTPAAAFCLQLLGLAGDDARVATAVDYTVARRPEAYRRYDDDDFVLRGQGNVYFWYYGTLCCFLRGGDAWAQWNERLRTVLPAAQAKDGSFPPIDVYAEQAGDTRRDRSYTTAMCVLSLEVYYRYFTPLLLGR